MARIVLQPLAPPIPELASYSASLQQNLEDLYGVSHAHEVKTVAPSESTGSIGDIVPVVEAGVYKLFVKFPGGWKSAVLI